MVLADTGTVSLSVTQENGADKYTFFWQADSSGVARYTYPEWINGVIEKWVSEAGETHTIALYDDFGSDLLRDACSGILSGETVENLAITYSDASEPFYPRRTCMLGQHTFEATATSGAEGTFALYVLPYSQRKTGYVN